LHCMLKKYSQIVLAIETVLDFEDHSIERLKAVKDRELGRGGLQIVEGAPSASPWWQEQQAQG